MIVHLITKQISYRRDNARRDRLYGKSTPDSMVDTHELADKVCQIYRAGSALTVVSQASNFRYVVWETNGWDARLCSRRIYTYICELLLAIVQPILGRSFSVRNKLLHILSDDCSTPTTPDSALGLLLYVKICTLISIRIMFSATLSSLRLLLKNLVT